MTLTIGSPRHKLFPVHKTPGAVSHVASVPELGPKIDTANLIEFSYLAPGETTTIDEVCIIEVVDFHHETYRGKHIDSLATRRLKVGLGGSISGPILWRTVEQKVDQPGDNGASRNRIVANALMALSIVCIAVGFRQYLTYWVAGGPSVGLESANLLWLAAGIVTVSWSFMIKRTAREQKELVKNPEISVFGPSKITWA